MFLAAVGVAQAQALGLSSQGEPMLKVMVVRRTNRRAAVEEDSGVDG